MSRQVKGPNRARPCISDGGIPLMCRKDGYGLPPEEDGSADSPTIFVGNRNAISEFALYSPHFGVNSLDMDVDSMQYRTGSLYKVKISTNWFSCF